jgi:cell division septum initiation protein DivIVA
MKVFKLAKTASETIASTADDAYACWADHDYPGMQANLKQIMDDCETLREQVRSALAQFEATH